MIYMPSFVKIGSAIQKFMGDAQTHRQHGDGISLLYDWESRERLLTSVSVQVVLYNYVIPCEPISQDTPLQRYVGTPPPEEQTKEQVGLLLCSAYFSTLKMEAVGIYSSETSVNCYLSQIFFN
jgi:hypothetical protein